MGYKLVYMYYAVRNLFILSVFTTQLKAERNWRLPSVHLCSLSKQHQDTDLEFLSQGCRKQLKCLSKQKTMKNQWILVNKPIRGVSCISIFIELELNDKVWSLLHGNG